MIETARTLLAVPHAPDPPARSRWDWMLVCGLVALGLVEGLYGSFGVWRPVVVGLGLIMPVTLLWRRARPFTTLVVGFGLGHAAFLGTVLGGGDWSWPRVPILVALMLTYSLMRWGSGAGIVAGLVGILVSNAVNGEVLDPTRSWADVAFGFAFSLFPAVLGVTMRYRADVHLSRIRDARRGERERLARELHDTVAHHVSAIAVQAQAAAAVFAKNPDASKHALALIEEEASRTLEDMRAIVGALREGEAADTAPQRRLHDIERLASTDAEPRIEVEFSGALEGLGPAIEAGLYRLAQESVTNARRHAKDARRIRVAVHGNGDQVQLRVSDDGQQQSRRGVGYGLIGMQERAELLGGRFNAGPSSDGGWEVGVDLPRRRAVT